MCVTVRYVRPLWDTSLSSRRCAHVNIESDPTSRHAEDMFKAATSSQGTSWWVFSQSFGREIPSKFSHFRKLDGLWNIIQKCYEIPPSLHSRMLRFSTRLLKQCLWFNQMFQIDGSFILANDLPKWAILCKRNPPSWTQIDSRVFGPIEQHFAKTIMS